MQNYYCVYCGAKYSAINLLTLNLCPRNPENPRGNHKLYEGSEKPHYFCKYCGAKYPTIGMMTLNLCHKSPLGRHSPAL